MQMDKETQFSRIEALIGKDAQAILARSKVAIFGLGGVGGYTVEALARSGIGAIALVDGDNFTLSNINRQLYATHSTIGKAKVDIAAQRILDINPNCKITKYRFFYDSQTYDSIDLTQFDYIVDAIDTVSAKIELIKRAQAYNIPIISCMGAGNRLKADVFAVDDIYNTFGCPLAKKIRKLCMRNNIEKLKVVYSKESPQKSKFNSIGSVAFATGTAGLMLAGEVVMDLIDYKNAHCPA